MIEDSELAVARQQLALQLGRLSHGTVRYSGDEQLIADATAQLHALADRFELHQVRVREPGDMSRNDAALVPVGSVLSTHEFRPFSGPGSPWGTNIVVRRSDAGVEGLVTLGAGHEGAPGRSHGGIVAGLLDDISGYVLHTEQTAAFTGELTVRYEAPMPLHVPLVLKAWLDNAMGRKLFIVAEVWHGQQRIAFSRGTFIRGATD